MKKILIPLIAIVALLIVFGGSFLSVRTQMIAYEEQIDATYISNQASFDAKWKEFKEMAQVTKLQEQQFKSVYTDLITGRNQDENLLFKMIQEDNPRLETSVYIKLQDAISTNERSFNNDQKAIADKINIYNTYIRTHFIVATLLGKERMDSKKFIVTSETTQQAFSSGKADEVNILE